MAVSVSGATFQYSTLACMVPRYRFGHTACRCRAATRFNRAPTHWPWMNRETIGRTVRLRGARPPSPWQQNAPAWGTPGRMQSRVGGGTSSGFGTGEAEANRPPHQARDVVDLEPSHELGPMSVHGLHAEVETPGDLFRSAPFGDELHDLALPRREAVRFAGHLRAAGEVLGDQWLGDAWAEVEVAPRHSADG